MTKESAQKYGNEISEMVYEIRRHTDLEMRKVDLEYKQKLIDKMEYDLDISIPHIPRIVDVEAIAEANGIDTVIIYKKHLEDKISSENNE